MTKKREPLRCPPDYRPGCSCSTTALEPSEDCYYHGYPDERRCPFCNAFRGAAPCKRCGCDTMRIDPAIYATEETL